MRRLFGVVFLAVLTMVPGIVNARTLSSVAPTSADLGRQLLLRFFGETSDADASLAAAYGDARSESPLRDLALSVSVVRPTGGWNVASIPPTFAASAPVVSDDVPILDADGAFSASRAAQFEASAAPLAAGQADIVASPSGRTFVSGQYRPSPSDRDASTSAATAPFGQFESGAPAPLAFSQQAGTASWSTSASKSAAVGPLDVRARFDSAQLSQPQSSLTDGGYGAGADVNVRAGHRNLDFTVSSDYERLMRDDPSASAALSPSTNWQLPGGDVPLVVPNYADMSRVSVGAGLAVPVVNNLTLNLNVASDRMLGAYGLPGVNNLDATDNSYGGRLTFAIPHSAGSLSISAQQLHYQDNLMPSDTYSQTRENVNFTVKF